MESGGEEEDDGYGLRLSYWVKIKDLQKKMHFHVLYFLLFSQIKGDGFHKKAS